MKINLIGVHNGKYDLFDSLSFNIQGFNIDKNINEFENKFEVKEIELKIDKTSALEIMHTLLDSENLLTNENEKLICDIDERINGGLND